MEKLLLFLTESFFFFFELSSRFISEPACT